MKLTENHIDCICDHLGIGFDELGNCLVAPQEFYSAVRDLSHMPREDKRAVLNRSKKFYPQIIDGCKITLYTQVQQWEGATRCSAARIIQDLDEFIWVF